MLPVPNLSWRPDLFSAVTTAPLVGRKLTPEMMCSCGCGLSHNNAVSRVVETEGFGFTTRKVLWYRSAQCRAKHMGVSMPMHYGKRP